MNNTFKNRIIPKSAIEISKDIFVIEKVDVTIEYVVFNYHINVCLYTKIRTSGYNVDELVESYNSDEDIFKFEYNFGGNTVNTSYFSGDINRFEDYASMRKYAEKLEYKEIKKFTSFGDDE